MGDFDGLCNLKTLDLSSLEYLNLRQNILTLVDADIFAAPPNPTNHSSD